jgi:hypothetical protein
MQPLQAKAAATLLQLLPGTVARQQPALKSHSRSVDPRPSSADASLLPSAAKAMARTAAPWPCR